MKKLACLILLGAALLSVSCSKKPVCCVLPQPIIMTAQKMAPTGSGPLSMSTVSNTKKIYISTAGPQSLKTATDSLAINLQFSGIGTYTPTDAALTYTVFSNGVKTTYALDQTFENKIGISEFYLQNNPASTTPDPRVMKATFNLRFTDPEHTTSVPLLNGKITAYLAN